MTKANKLRELFSKNRIIRVMGAHNAVGAKLAERAGFDAIWASGLEISTSYGVPDANILTMTDFLNSASSINGVVSVPVIADCDTGFGNSNNVIHMVKKYEAAGIAAVCIEDKHFPKVNSFIPGRQELAPISEFVGKILAAKNAQSDKDFMIIARVEALIAGWDMDEAIRRANAYVNAGADAILIHSKSKTLDEIAEFVKRWNNRAPLVVVPTTYFKVTVKDLERLKIKMVIYANHGMRASIRAMQKVFNEIFKSGTTASVEGNITTMQEVFELQGMNKMKEEELVYSVGHEDKISAVIPVAGDHLKEYSMKDVFEDIPIAMLDINGKSLLQRQVEVLNRCKIYDIRVVGGYKKEKINVDGIKMISNDEYKTTGILYSIMVALRDIGGPAVITYGDILFDHFLINKLFDKGADVILIVDNTYNAQRMVDKKKAELVVTEGKIEVNKRMLHRDSLHNVKRIGSSVKKDETNLEFCGVMFLSSTGVKMFKEVYSKCLKSNNTKKRSKAERFLKISLADFLQLLIDKEYKISCLDVNTGWLEINSIDEYKLACSLFR